MRILLVSDAWSPQVNGVVTCLQALLVELRELGHEVKLLSPQDFRSRPCPTYPEIPLVWDLWRVGAAIRAFQPECVHLATEGPLGWAARRWLNRQGLAYSSAVHTRFPDYVHGRWPWIPLAWGYAYLRAFHRSSQTVLVSTERLSQELAGFGLERLRLWRKGVDTRLFQPRALPARPHVPVFLFVGRLAVEKNLAAFLDLDLPGEKRVVGDGPQRAELQARYPHVRFCGYRQGEALAQEYRGASVLVFPSRTDTYGLVMLEALACGTPVAAFAVPGPLDVLEPGITGVMDADLGRACRAALLLDREECATRARQQSWRASALEFVAQQTLLAGDVVAEVKAKAEVVLEP